MGGIGLAGHCPLRLGTERVTEPEEGEGNAALIIHLLNFLLNLHLLNPERQFITFIFLKKKKTTKKQNKCNFSAGAANALLCWMN